MRFGRKLKNLKRLIEILFFYRDITGVFAFFIVYLFSEISFNKLYLAIPFILLGLFLRIWGYFYLGDIGYSLKFRNKFLVVNGIYRYLKHPIYLGNFLILIGFLLFLKMPIIFLLGIIIFFLTKYSLFIYYEEKIAFNKTQNFKIIKVKPSFKNCLKELKTISLILLALFLFFLKI
ncbi:MAG: phosphatidylethanolamine N-methyltransferase family protein [candidate division WOR-3 bacterium]|nr:phosphatidylethanolamine N-methyltransferase family protein [candidate division WOR-3 bacterium]MCX7837058.1 phosphatidylethanolamine N-methyltransferase family protein [candidate division WOR-3 bacterium]MDW8114230.1 methyltransferase [candidate division WOR-3 bacterium]